MQCTVITTHSQERFRDPNEGGPGSDATIGVVYGRKGRWRGPTDQTTTGRRLVFQRGEESLELGVEGRLGLNSVDGSSER